MDNPYNPLQSNPEYYYGREEAFAFFRQNLVGAAHKHALVLVGRRGLGKTSLLHQLPYQLDERYSLCIVSLGLIGLGDEHSFFAALVDDIRSALEQAEASTYRLPEWPEDAEPGELRDWFRDEYLEIALTALRTRHLLLALDDAHLLLEAIDHGALPADHLDYLLAVLLKYPRLDMLFTLDEAFEDRILSLELFRDPTLHFRLAELSLEDAERLVREPVQDVYHYEDGVIEQILALAGGHPFLLHSICRLLFRRSEERHHAGPVIENDLAAVDDAVLDQGSDVLNPLWQAASQNERLVLTGMVRLSADHPDEGVAFGSLYDWINTSGYEMNKTKVAAALRSLDYKGLIRAEPDGTYALMAQFIPRWLNANHALDVKKKTASKINTATLVPLGGLGAALLLVGGLVAASLAGVFDGDEAVPSKGSPTATLSLNYQASQQAFSETQTQQARPTRTSSPTRTPTATTTPNLTATQRSMAETAKAEVTATVPPTKTIPTETKAATRTPRPLPTNTPRPTATLDPGD